MNATLFSVPLESTGYMPLLENSLANDLSGKLLRIYV